MRAPRALALAVLVSGLSVSAAGRVSADHSAGGPCTPAPCPPLPSVVVSAPVVDARTGTVVLTMQRMAHGQPRTGAILLLDGRSGVLLHRLRVDAPVIFTTPVVDPHIGTIFVGVHDVSKGQPRRASVLLMVDGARGTLLHRVALDAVLLVADRVQDRLYVTTRACVPAGASPCGANEQAVTALDARTGAVLWTIPLGLMPQAVQGARAFQPLSALVTGPRGRRLVFIGRTGVRVLDLPSRRLSAWTPVPGVGCPLPAAADDQGGHVVLTSSTWNVNTGHLCSSVSILDTRTGRLVSSLTMAGPVQADTAHQLLSTTAVDPQRHRAVVVGLNPGMGGPKMLTIRLFDTRSGGLLRTIALPPYEWTDFPVVADTRTGRAFLPVIVGVPGTFGHIHVRVYVVDTATARLIARVSLLPAGLCCIRDVMAVDEQGGHVFIVSPTTASTTTRVSVLGARRGVLLHTVTLGSLPDSLTVDPRTARIFVFGADTSPISVLDGHTGHLVFTRSLGPPGATPRPSWVQVTVAPSGSLFVLHAFDSVVSVLDGHTGRVLTTIAPR